MLVAVPIRTKRWNDPREPDDGYRLLICRYRPRGVAKAAEAWDAWCKALGPSDDLHAAAYGKTGAPLAFAEYERRFREEMTRQRYWIEGFAAHLKRGDTITLLVAHDVGCEVCMAIHSAVMTRTVGDPAMLAALRSKSPLADARLEALRSFTLRVMATKGDSGEPELGAFLAAGFTKENALDVVLGVGTYTLSTYANRLTRAPLDAPLADFAWSGDDGR